MDISNLNQTFTTACTNGDIKTVKELYNKYYAGKSKFSKFLSIFRLNSVLNLHWDNDSPIVGACLGGQYDVIQFLLSDKKFKNIVQKNNRLASGLHLAIGAGDLEIVKFILPLVKENETCYEKIYSGFVNACRVGHLDIVKYIINQSIFDLEKFDKKAFASPCYSMKCKGFITACENGQIDIVKYLTNSFELKKTVDLNEVNTVVKIDRFEIMEYFIFGLNLKQNHSFMMRLNMSYELENYTLDLLDKKKSYKQLAKELKQSKDIKEKPSRKMKL
jgi:ankyrin repeat protein